MVVCGGGGAAWAGGTFGDEDARALHGGGARRLLPARVERQQVLEVRDELDRDEHEDDRDETRAEHEHEAFERARRDVLDHVDVVEVLVRRDELEHGFRDGTRLERGRDRTRPTETTRTRDLGRAREFRAQQALFWRPPSKIVAQTACSH